MKEIEIIKKNRKYFAAKLGNYDCKILIDENSENLSIGKHTLLLDDISVRTDFGTDLIFKLPASAEQQKEAGICTLKPELSLRNIDLMKKVRGLEGQWDQNAKAWVFSKIIEDHVEKLDEYYNSNFIDIEVEFLESDHRVDKPYELMGYELASATDRVSGVLKKEGVLVIAGGFGRGRSFKKWTTSVQKGTVIRMKVAQAVLDAYEVPEHIEITRL